MGGMRWALWAVVLTWQLHGSLQQQCGDSNVLSFGATGNGNSDDSGAFSKMEGDATVGIIFMPRGTYRIAQGGTLELTKSIIAEEGAVFQVRLGEGKKGTMTRQGNGGDQQRLSVLRMLSIPNSDGCCTRPWALQVDGGTTLKLFGQPEHPYSLFFQGTSTGQGPSGKFVHGLEAAGCPCGMGELPWARPASMCTWEATYIHLILHSSCVFVANAQTI